MSNFLQALFNTNHDQPSFLVFVILAFIALVVPNLTRYLYESRRSGSRTTSRTSSQSTSTAKPRHQHKKKKR